MPIEKCDSEGVKISKAFKDTLMHGLHSYLRDMHKYFHALRPIGLDAREELYRKNKEEIDAGMPYSGDLLLYGMTPLTIFYASEAVTGLIERFLQYGVLNKELPSLSRTGNTFVGGTSGMHSIIMREIVRTAECNFESASKILEWCIDILPYKPCFFRGLYAVSTEDKILLYQMNGNTTLRYRWSIGMERCHWDTQVIF